MKTIEIILNSNNYSIITVQDKIKELENLPIKTK